MRRSLCNAQIPNANPTIAAPGTEQTGILWIPHHRLHGGGVPAQKMRRLAGGDVRDASGVVPGAGGQGRVIGRPSKIEYPVIVNVQVDPIRFWQTKR